jgi:hypothetical protein
MDAARKETDALHDPAGALFDRMIAIPATPRTGRSAKVSTYRVYVLGCEWLGAEIDDWSIDQPRKLLGEFAGDERGRIGRNLQRPTNVTGINAITHPQLLGADFAVYAGLKPGC